MVLINESLKYLEFCFLVRTSGGVGRGVGLSVDGERDGVGETIGEKVEVEDGCMVGFWDDKVGEREGSGGGE